MPTELPLEPSNPNQRFSTTLDSEEFVLDVHWNERAAAWFMNIYAVDGTLIAGGLKLVIGTLIGSRATSAKFPKGYFVVADTSGQRKDATLDDLGTRVGVAFYSYVDVFVLYGKVEGYWK